MSKPYLKPALTFDQQLAKLRQRGMQIENEHAAINALSSISYYRLSAYWYPFRQRDTHDRITSYLRPETSFEQVIQLYEFDRHLRLLVLDGIERVEVAIRTQLTYHLGQTYGAFAHIDARHFHHKFDHRKWLSQLEAETMRSSDEFIRHYQAQYQGFPRVPIWMLTEVMSLGSLSLCYKGLNNDQKTGVEDKKAISQHFNLHHKRLTDWLHTLTYVRNVCAHHSRLWNRELAIRPDKVKDAEWLPPITPRNDRIFYILLMIRHLLRAHDHGNHWANQITQLLTPIAAVPEYRIAMGLPDNWRNHPIWR